MKSSRWEKASLAINAIIRGLDLDQIAFRYDETAGSEIECRADTRAPAAHDKRAEQDAASVEQS